MERVGRFSEIGTSALPLDPPRRARSGGMLVALYSGTLLLAALLLFSVQPMFTKRVLPLLGGTPGVWSVAMVVFQGLLLVGYAYAHVLTRYLPLRAAMALHALVLVLGFSALPITIAAGFEESPQQAQALWLVGLFLASIGAPYFALSASAPCSRPGSRAPATRMPTTRTSSTGPRISARSRPCSPTPS